MPRSTQAELMTCTSSFAAASITPGLGPRITKVLCGWICQGIMVNGKRMLALNVI